jgi:hypothetical protein
MVLLAEMDQVSLGIIALKAPALLRLALSQPLHQRGRQRDIESRRRFAAAFPEHAEEVRRSITQRKYPLDFWGQLDYINAVPGNFTWFVNQWGPRSMDSDQVRVVLDFPDMFSCLDFEALVGQLRSDAIVPAFQALIGEDGDNLRKDTPDRTIQFRSAVEVMLTELARNRPADITAELRELVTDHRRILTNLLEDVKKIVFVTRSRKREREHEP